MATFGQILKGLREEAGLTQRELAGLAGTTQRAMSFWEADQREPTPANLRRLCAALGVCPDAFAAAAGTAPRGSPSRPRARLGPTGGVAWTPAEDELVRTLPPAEAARAIARGMGAVYERRRVLGVPDGRRRGPNAGG